MSHICILVLMGLPGAGKTHFCKYILEHFSSSDTTVSHISFDEYEKEIGHCIYKDMRVKIYKQVDHLIQNILDSNVLNKWLLVIDDNMYYRSMRRSYYNLAKQYKTGFCQIYITCNIDTAISRNSQRIDNKVPVEIIQDMARKFEPPGNNSWEQYSCQLYSSNTYTNLTYLWNMIDEAMKNPMIPEEQVIFSADNSTSLIHNLDILLRKIVGVKLKNAVKNQMSIQELATDLAIKKKQVFDALKSNEIFLPDCADLTVLECFLCTLIEKWPS